MKPFRKHVVETANPTSRFVLVALSILLINQIGCRAALLSNPLSASEQSSIDPRADERLADDGYVRPRDEEKRYADGPLADRRGSGRRESDRIESGSSELDRREARWREADRIEAARRAAIRRESVRRVADGRTADRQTSRRRKLRMMDDDEIQRIRENSRDSSNEVEQASYRQTADGYPDDSLLGHIEELNLTNYRLDESNRRGRETGSSETEVQMPVPTPLRITPPPSMTNPVRDNPSVINMGDEGRSLAYGAQPSVSSPFLNIDGQVLNPRSKLASQKAFELYEMNRELLEIIGNKSAQIRDYKSTVQELENRLYQSERTIERLRAEIDQVQAENLTLRSKLRLVEAEKLEIKRQTDESLGQIESKLDGLLLNNISTTASPPEKPDKN